MAAKNDAVGTWSSISAAALMADPGAPVKLRPAGGGPDGSRPRPPTKPPRNLSRFITPNDRRRAPSVLYSRVVSFLKVVLPASALALAVLFFVWPYWSPSERNFRVRPIKIAAGDLENLNVVGARFVGLDGDNQPFTLMADQAVQANAEGNVMELESPKGDITLRDGTWLSINSSHGNFHRRENALVLTGDVSLFQDNGYEVHTEQATIDLKHGVASGDQPVRGQGPGIQLEGKGFQIFDRGARVVITGASRLVVLPSSAPTALPAVR